MVDWFANILTAILEIVWLRVVLTIGLAVLLDLAFRSFALSRPEPVVLDVNIFAAVLMMFEAIRSGESIKWQFMVGTLFSFLWLAFSALLRRRLELRADQRVEVVIQSNANNIPPQMIPKLLSIGKDVIEPEVYPALRARSRQRRETFTHLLSHFVGEPLDPNTFRTPQGCLHVWRWRLVMFILLLIAIAIPALFVAAFG